MHSCRDKNGVKLRKKVIGEVKYNIIEIDIVRVIHTIAVVHTALLKHEAT